MVNQSKRMVLPALAAAAMLTLSGCSAFEEEPDDVVYCVDESNTVVDDAKCDDTTTTNSGTSPLFWYMMGRYNTGLPLGSKLDPSQSTQRVPFNDPAARSAAGLNKSGTVATGKSVSGKSGGFGTGTSGKPGGFGGSGTHGG